MGGSDGEIQQESTTLDSQTEFAIRIEESPVDSVSDGETQQESTTSDSEPEVAIDIEESWVDSVRSRVNASFVPKWRKESCTIFRVPANLRAVHPEAYEPTVVSIGPYHHGKVHLEPMEKHKRRMLGRLLSRRRDVDRRRHEDALRECLRKVKALEERARSCYSEVIDMESNDFVEMMVLDGCFLIGLLLLTKAMMMEVEDEDARVVWEGQKDEEEMHYNSSNLLTTVKHDLLKVENQMPFFVVEALFDLLVLQPDNGPSASISMYDLALTLLKKWNPSCDPYTATINHPKDEEGD
ncbi:UPF0481 protein [Acorus calamus]|uniref:UPF0481 protein n=1 Tax=Acorus calamus TaxID=4465 RepID=A0AAV9C7S5_ACOCL|nr:UPF0481 protein [Acorus calamus]